LYTTSRYLEVAVKLATRATNANQASSYKSNALTQWQFISKSGLINSNNLVCDSIDISTCKVTSCVTLTYTSGVLIGALIELGKLDSSTDYIGLAVKIGNAVITNLVSNGILSEGGTNPSADAAQWKGAFVRNLMLLHQVSPQQSFVNFFQKNADSIWANDRNTGDNRLGPSWQGPFLSEATMAASNSGMPSQNAAISCLLGAHVALGGS
jgi:predicted alpha-1,6-mannanase (GH76 family)